jgi:putative FmdB family regulatory protein
MAVPTYDYRCSTCEETYELRESFSAPLEHTCEKCGNGVAKRVLSAPRIVFKGSGWYITDSRSKSSAISDNDGGSSESTTDSKSETTKTTSPDLASAAS